MSKQSEPFQQQLIRVFVLVYGGLLGACDRADTELDAMPATPLAADNYWAVNVGGEDYIGIDGVKYRADEYISGGSVGEMPVVKGSQDSTLYRSYREGDISISKPLESGRYDLTFHFAEPDEKQAGERLINAFVDGIQVIENLDVMLFRDGKVHSALTVTIPGIDVNDELTVTFAATAGTPMLSAFVVRAKDSQMGQWNLVWSDEFENDGAPDGSRWNIELWEPRKVNDEDQAYTSQSKNVRVEDGHLIIEAHKEDLDGAEYTSGRVHSNGKGDFLYGRFEIRAKLPRGQGTWPAIWMLPSNPFTYATKCSDDNDWQGSAECDAWPNSGEIDIMEHVGYQMNHVHGTVHTEAYYWLKWEQRKGRVLLDAVDEEFHVYALEWSPTHIDVFVDDVLYFTYMNENKGWREWPFDQPFHLILNIAVGGVWGRAGGPIDDTVFPQKMLIDYVRVYESMEL